jgi:hypothetical protein
MRWLLSHLGYPALSRRHAKTALRRPQRLLTLERLEDRTLPALTITPSFDSSITSDANAAAIESTINSAISFYESAFTNPIDVTIQFKEINSGFGLSNATFYPIPYTTFRAALAAEPQTADTATALANLPNQTNNPVNGGADLFIKTAEIRALGIAGNFPPTATGGFDGLISLNTTVSTPGSPGSSGQFSLLALTEHEIDEVLGLGSALPSLGNGSGFPPSAPLPEDLYRYTSGGSRTWVITGDDAFFSLDGTTDLAQFNQGNVNNNNGDYGDWWSNNGAGNAGSNPPARVQDAVLFGGTTPTLGNDAGHVEQRALNVIGYTLAGPSITTTTLETYWTTGTSGYSQTIVGTGGTGALTFSVTGGALPTGLNLNPASGVLAGTPSAVGSFTFTVTVTDSAAATGSRSFTIVIIPSEFVYDQNAHTLVITLIPALPNFDYSQSTTANGSATSSVYTFTLASSASTISQTFPDVALTTAPSSGATVTVKGQGAAGTAILILNDTYVDGNDLTQDTPERVSLGSRADAGVGAVAKFVGNSSSNASYSFMALSNFPISYAYVGRNDGTVSLYGTAGAAYNGFVSAGNYSYIGGPGLFHLAQGATSVYGYSAGQPTDFAYQYSANPGSAFVVSGVAFSYMSCTDQNPSSNNATQPYFNVGVGFLVNTGVSENPGLDIAYVIDSPGNDTFIGGSAFSYMYIQNADGSFAELDTAYSFALVDAQSFVGGFDTAVNNDPTKNIVFGFHLA